MVRIGHNSERFKGDKWREAIDRVKALLRATPVGETATYRAISAAAGTRVGPSHHVMRSALKALLTKEGLSFTNMPTVGYRRSDDADGVSNGNHHRLKAHRSNKRGLAHIKTVKRENLSRHDRLTYYGVATALQEGVRSTRAKPTKTIIKNEGLLERVVAEIVAPKPTKT